MKSLDKSLIKQSLSRFSAEEAAEVYAALCEVHQLDKRQLLNNWKSLKGECKLEDIKFLRDNYGVKFQIHFKNLEFEKAFNFNLPKSSDTQKEMAFKLTKIKNIFGSICGHSAKEIALKKTKELYREACECGGSIYKYSINDKVIQEITLSLKERDREKIEFFDKPEDKTKKDNFDSQEDIT